MKTLYSLLVSLIVLVAANPAQAETYYYHNDHLGTPQVVTDVNQQVVWQGDYTPFGEVAETIATVTQNLRFPGQYFDQETGLHYNYYRDYSPSIGRYVESDPIGMNGGLNLFRYVGNNPHGGYDLLGLLEIRSYPIKSQNGPVDRYEIEFHPIAKDAIGIATKIGRLGRKIDSIIDYIGVKPAGPKRPRRDYLQCGFLDSDLQKDYQGMFPDDGRISREQAEQYLTESFEKYPQMSTLYDSPKNLLDKASDHGSNHIINKIIFGNF